MTTSSVVLVGTEEIAIVRLGLAVIGLGTEGIAALSAPNLPCQPSCLGLNRFGNSAVIEALAPALDPGASIHDSLMGSQHQRMPLQRNRLALVGLTARVQIGPVCADEIFWLIILVPCALKNS